MDKRKFDPLFDLLFYHFLANVKPIVYQEDSKIVILSQKYMGIRKMKKPKGFPLQLQTDTQADRRFFIKISSKSIFFSFLIVKRGGVTIRNFLPNVKIFLANVKPIVSEGVENRNPWPKIHGYQEN